MSISNIFFKALVKDPKFEKTLEKIQKNQKDKHRAFKFRIEGTTLLLYSSGKVIGMGAKSENQMKKSIQLFQKQLQKLSYLKVTDPIITNVVYSDCFEQCIDLSSVKLKVPIIYNGEIFPGMEIQLNEATVILFTSGKYYITNNKSLEECIDNNMLFRALIEEATDEWVTPFRCPDQREENCIKTVDIRSVTTP